MIGKKTGRVSEKRRASIQDIKRTYALLLPYILKHKAVYIGLLFLLFINIGLTIAFAWFFGAITDAAVQGDIERVKTLIPIGAMLIAVSILSTIGNTYLEAVSVQAVKRDLKAQLFKHICLLPAHKVANVHSGEYLTHFTNDINSINGVIGSSLINFIKLPLIYICIFGYLIRINLQLSLLSFFIIPIAALAGVGFGPVLRRNTRRIYEVIGKTSSLLSETFLGLPIIRSFLMERMMYRFYDRHNQELYDLELKNAQLRGWFRAGSRTVSMVTFLGSLCLGAYFVANQAITVGMLLTFISLIDHLIYPVTGLAGQWGGFQRSVSAVERIANVLDQSIESTSLPAYIPPTNKHQSISFQNITFSYDGTRNIFEQFHLNIPAGKVVAIVGSSGAGKSTLFHLLQGFYKPQAGGILLNDVPIHELSPSELRSCISYVPQETYLFAGTIRDNLMLAKPQITEEEMITAARNAQIHEFIQSLPNGYDTEIGERGMKLSGGQKQRIAIARAILKDAPILLLDEATSALDSETEYDVQVTLQNVMQNRTTLIIAHRLSTIQHADVIVVLEQGKIVQMGNHQELMRRKGLYRKLNRIVVS
ncbi:ABC transporter ATP-binding protein [Ectobacillus polymachus]|uniref:ABC transporter ATP-binding protein n=1 Tax=Ectobacillus polymachus TaxID=1508806 RepID=UPI003A8B7DA6